MRQEEGGGGREGEEHLRHQGRHSSDARAAPTRFVH